MNPDVEKYILSRRTDFENLESFDVQQGWSDLNARRRTARRKRMILLRSAAAIFLIISTVLVLKLDDQNETVENSIFSELRSEYDEILNQRMQVLKIESVDSEEIRFLMKEFELLDQNQSEILLNAGSTPEKMRILELLRKDYERKLRIIELLERELNKNKNEIFIQQI